MTLAMVVSLSAMCRACVPHPNIADGVGAAQIPPCLPLQPQDPCANARRPGRARLGHVCRERRVRRALRRSYR